jgi:hypothetical protein
MIHRPVIGINNISEVYQPREKEFQGAYAFGFSKVSSRKGVARRASSAVDEDAHCSGRGGGRRDITTKDRQIAALHG